VKLWETAVTVYVFQTHSSTSAKRDEYAMARARCGPPGAVLVDSGERWSIRRESSAAKAQGVCASPEILVRATREQQQFTPGVAVLAIDGRRRTRRQAGRPPNSLSAFVERCDGVCWCMFRASMCAKGVASLYVDRCAKRRNRMTLLVQNARPRHNGVQGVAGSNPAVPT
jgi:hypothetical protein